MCFSFLTLTKSYFIYLFILITIIFFSLHYIVAAIMQKVPNILPVLLILQRLKLLEFIQSSPQLLLRHGAFVASVASVAFTLSSLLPTRLPEIQNGIHLGHRVWFVRNPVLGLKGQKRDAKGQLSKAGFKDDPS